mmetsp:Transcript_48205/g.89889  ORF Transcript_48205/g.89889 Transcript_48205/m.89889 type:complete len:200 (+) Transcript_48205:481-1080(+)
MDQRLGEARKQQSHPAVREDHRRNVPFWGGACPRVQWDHGVCDHGDRHEQPVPPRQAEAGRVRGRDAARARHAESAGSQKDVWHCAGHHRGCGAVQRGRAVSTRHSNAPRRQVRQGSLPLRLLHSRELGHVFRVLRVPTEKNESPRRLKRANRGRKRRKDDEVADFFNTGINVRSHGGYWHSTWAHLHLPPGLQMKERG